VYVRIGERVYHFLIDEFQDTSPIQWRNLSPLVENSLSMGGSLFAVGDTKQAIYGFRQADYTIMKSLEEENPFPSASHEVRELEYNWRSRPRVLEFASLLFRRNAAGSPEYAAAARRSGLDEWTQEARGGEDPGYVEVEVLERDDEDPVERGKVHALMEELRSRGYRWGDIAILAPRNEDVLRATSWLNEKGIPVLSFSSLDVRRRGVAGEIFALLAFLDSPPDDLAFATFLLGAIFARTLASRHGWTSMGPLHSFLFRCRAERPLYKAFQREFPGLWSECFEGLFRSAGYLPVYDLVSEAYAVFDVFALAAEEEATLAKLLEGVMAFEGSGSNSLREFLGAAGGDGEQWAIAVPRGADSVRAMTVHKSKGLGFPVTIVLLYGETHRGFPYTLARDRGMVELVKITKEIAGRDPALAALYDEEVEKEKVNRLNSLYVALTRAKREMYVIAVKPDRDSFPFDLLPAESFPPSPDKGNAASDPVPAEARAELSYEARTMQASPGEGRLSREERRRGELVHRMLSLVEYAEDDLEARLAAAGRRAALEAREPDSGPGESVTDAAAAACALLIRGTELGAYFARRPERQVLTEQEFCDSQGKLYRMDRVVVDPDRVTVIDFKTGPETSAEYDADLRNYARILSDAYPGRAVDAYLAYVDRREMRRVP
jgi:ATP-dependent exoDNAse (exonuclease V) beta subunit